MDHFFEGNDILQNDAFWSDLAPVLPNQSAFQPYTSIPRRDNIAVNGSNSISMNKRMIEFVKRSFAVSAETQESESTRCYRRKMCERMRREKEKKGYLELHSILPLGTKNDKNSIMQMASKRIQELKTYKEVLQRRNLELEVKLAAMGMGKGNNTRTTVIKFKVADPNACGITYMVEVAKCLKSLGSNIRSIQSRFSDQQLVAAINIESQILDAEVRKEVQRTLQDVQRKLHFNFQGDGGKHRWKSLS